MISGHTHELKLYEENNILYLNPGSLTGARTVVNTGKKEHIPSFMLLDVNQNNIVIYIYKLINDKGKLYIANTLRPRSPMMEVFDKKTKCITSLG